ncbi:putative 3-isopropylmalate dehydratase large subunit [Actinacidiphila bryophytorum]|uniref:3-isopropylmalate dehydratase large subunit n=1 Tax=Actinacidiphila bryophytorum TaxID=1436133 RepID=A0A9W4H225_9ACTN|nr:putative 3-isopropylmalate dehydratase large subunit [Actinacidiphila bryophytorum]
MGAPPGEALGEAGRAVPRAPEKRSPSRVEEGTPASARLCGGGQAIRGAGLRLICGCRRVGTSCRMSRRVATDRHHIRGAGNCAPSPHRACGSSPAQGGCSVRTGPPAGGGLVAAAAAWARQAPTGRAGRHRRKGAVRCVPDHRPVVGWSRLRGAWRGRIAWGGGARAVGRGGAAVGRGRSGVRARGTAPRGHRRVLDPWRGPAGRGCAVRGADRGRPGCGRGDRAGGQDPGGRRGPGADALPRAGRRGPGVGQYRLLGRRGDLGPGPPGPRPCGPTGRRRRGAPDGPGGDDAGPGLAGAAAAGLPGRRGGRAHQRQKHLPRTARRQAHPAGGGNRTARRQAHARHRGGRPERLHPQARRQAHRVG